MLTRHREHSMLVFYGLTAHHISVTKEKEEKISLWLGIPGQENLA